MTSPVLSPGGLPLPNLDTSADIPADLLALGTALDSRVISRFATTTDRDSTYPASVAPFMARCLITSSGRRYTRVGTAAAPAWVETWTDGTYVVASGTRTIIGDALLTGARIYETDTGLLWVYRNGWLPLDPVAGKLWRTQGFTGAPVMAVATEYLITMGGAAAARLSGGFALSGDNIVIPFDGLYDVSYHFYVSGGTTATGSCWVRRTRAGASTAILTKGWFKSNSSVDHQEGHHGPLMPLKGGDLLGLVMYLYSGGGGLSYYGLGEGGNISDIGARWVAPLGSATPV